METFLSSDLDKVSVNVVSVILFHTIVAPYDGIRPGFHVLVGANSSSLESLGAQLFVLVGDHVNAEGKFIDICTLATEVEDTDLRIGYTTVESGFWIWLEKSVKSHRTQGHFFDQRASNRRDLDTIVFCSALCCNLGLGC